MLRLGPNIEVVRTIRFFSKNIKIADIQKMLLLIAQKNR